MKAHTRMHIKTLKETPGKIPVTHLSLHSRVYLRTTARGKAFLTSDDFEPVQAIGLDSLSQALKEPAPLTKTRDYTEACIQMAKVLLPPGARFQVIASFQDPFAKGQRMAWRYLKSFHDAPEWAPLTSPAINIPAGIIIVARCVA